MNTAIKAAMIATISIFSVSSAHASIVWLETTLGPQYTLKNSEGPQGDATFDPPAANNTSGLGYTTRNTLAFTPWPWLLVGGTLNYSNLPTTREAAPDFLIPDDGAGKEESTKKLEYGPSLGFVLGHFRVIGTYFLGGNKKVDSKIISFSGSTSSDSTKTYYVGSGYQINAAYMFNVSGKFKIGPALVYRFVKYKSRSIDDRTGSGSEAERDYYSDQVEGTFEPMVSLALEF